MSDNNCTMVLWNVRGLNALAKFTTVFKVASSWRPAILCLEETKIARWNSSLERYIGGGGLDKCFHLPAAGSRDGISLYWNSRTISISSPLAHRFSIFASVRMSSDNNSFLLTTVYGPTADAKKDEFLAKCVRLLPHVETPGSY